MAKQGFKVFDSDLHVIEPPDLWPRYIAPEFRSMAPVGFVSENIRELGLLMPGMPEPRRVGDRSLRPTEV